MLFEFFSLCKPLVTNVAKKACVLVHKPDMQVKCFFIGQNLVALRARDIFGVICVVHLNVMLKQGRPCKSAATTSAQNIPLRMYSYIVITKLLFVLESFGTHGTWKLSLVRII